MLSPRVIFCIFSISFNKETLSKQSQISGETTISLGPYCILQNEPTRASCECWQRRRWTKLFEWNVTHCLKLLFLLPQRNKPMPRNARQVSNQTSCFKPFILVGHQQIIGVPSLMPIFAGNIYL